MKISVIITTVLIAQVSASFFDVFQGAVLSVQNSFGKLLSDVVTDVKETVDCTILAVEHVLSLSEDASARYYDRCGNGTNKMKSESDDAQQDGSSPKVEVSVQFSNNEEYLNKEIPAEIDARINDTLSKMLNNYNPHENLLSVENVLAKESEKLADVSHLVKQELEKLSNEVHTDFKNIKQSDDSEPSVDSILHQIKRLENREQNTKNTSEANEIHQVIDEVLDKLDVIEATEATENVKLEEILKELESNSNNSFVGLRRQFDEWKEEESRHLDDIKNKMEEHERIANLSGNNRHESNHTQPVQLDTKMHEDDIKPPIIIGISSSLKTDAAVQQGSNDDDSNPNPTNKTSTDKDSIGEIMINSQAISVTEFNTQVKEILDSTTSPGTVENTKDVSSTTTTNEPTSVSYPLKDTALNDTVVTSTSSTIESIFVSKHESANATENHKPIILSTNESTAVQNKVDNTNNTVTSTTISLPNNAPVNKTSQTVETTTDSDKQQSSSLSTNEPTNVLKLIDGNKVESTYLSKITDSVDSNTDSGKEELTLRINNSTITPDAASDSLSNETIITSSDDGKKTERTQDLLNNDNSNKTVITSTAITILGSANGDQIESQKDKSERYSENGSSPSTKPATTPETFNDNDANDAMITRTSSAINVSTPVSSVQPEETIEDSGNDESSTIIMDKLETASKIVNDNDLNDTIIASFSLPIVSETIQPIDIVEAPDDEDSSTVALNELYSTTTTNIVNGNDSNDTVITSSSLSSSITPILRTPASETFLLLETTEAFGKDKSSTETKHESSDTITDTPSLNITQVSGTVHPVENTLASAYVESSTMSTNKPIPTIITAYDDDSNATEMTSTSVSIPENIPVSKIDQSIQQVENTTAVESEDSLTLTTPGIKIDTDSNEKLTTSSSSSTKKSTLVSEIMKPVESTKPSKNVEPSTLSTNESVIIEDKVTNDDSDSNETVSNTDSAPVKENIQSVKINGNSEKQESPSISVTTTLNNTVTTSKSLTTTEIIPISETVSPVKGTIATTNEEYRELSSLTRNPPLTITESPLMNKNIPLIDRPAIPENREWLTPNKFIPPNYTNRAPINYYDLNSPQSIRDRMLKGEQPLINSNLSYGKPTVPANIMNQRPYYPTQAQPNYRDTSNSQNSAFNGILANPVNTDSKKLTPVTDSEEQKINAKFDEMDSILSQFLDTGSPLRSAEIVPKLSSVPKTPTPKQYTPRGPINPQKITYENPSYVQTPKNIISPSYPFERPSANTYRPPRGLTTYRPITPGARRANNYKNAPLDYDSFFHIPQKNTEAHDKALREARQLIANSKRSDQIINSILKNKNNYGARSIFNNPGPLNSGK